MAKETKKLSKQVADKRIIQSSLINKDEVFKMCALAESTGLCLLLEGVPGTAKTKTVIEYAKAWLMKDIETMDATAKKKLQDDFDKKVFILETDEGTKPSELKGIPNMAKLFEHNTYELFSPLADAEVVIINEIDKASSGVRNALLGIMNEKMLFNGQRKVPCKWKLFVATCNEIPKDEVKSPFWDRFMLKMKVSRVGAGELVKYYEMGGKDYKQSISVAVPKKEEIDNIAIHPAKLSKFLNVAYENLSDRTLTFVPTLAKAACYVWDVTVDKALIKVADVMLGKSAASTLQSTLINPNVKEIMNKIDMLNTMNTPRLLQNALEEIKQLTTTYKSTKKIDDLDIEEIMTSIDSKMDIHPLRDQLKSEEDTLDSTMEEAASVAQELKEESPVFQGI